MNKTADRNGKTLGRIFKPKIPYAESEHFIYILPDSLPTHTGLRKKYMAVCWPRILIGIPHCPERSIDPGPNVDL